MYIKQTAELGGLICHITFAFLFFELFEYNIEESHCHATIKKSLM
jgi:hypothetical protein